MKTDYSRSELISICEQSVVQHGQWRDRDTPSAQEGVGRAWVYLRAGCTFRVLAEGKHCKTDDRTIWIEIDHDDFGTRDWSGPGETETFYLPTPNRLDAANGKDWY